MRQPYPSYKDSGSHWLGSVPSHWSVVRADAVLVSNMAQVQPDSFRDRDVFHYSIPVVQESGIGHVESGENIQSSKLLVTEPQVLVSKLNPRKGTTCIAVPHELTTVCSGEFIPLVPREVDLHFTFYFVSSASYRQRLEARVESATRSHQRVAPSDIIKFKWALPPLDEQQTITAFLDRETGKIDALVEEQRRLIALLKEKRQAVISHAVTKGLDPDAPLKPSGIDWLGDIPEHWTVNKFARCVRIAEGQIDPRGEPYSAMMLIAPNHIETGTGRLVARETAADQGAMSGKYIFEAGAVIYSKIRPALAKVTVAPKSGLCSADMYPLTSRGHFEQEYLALIILSPGFTAWAMLESDRVAMPKINREKLNELRLPVPPLAEQRDIVEFLKGHTMELDTLISEAETAIDLLQERRSALISAAVTGKIDVRGEVAEQQGEQSLEGIEARGGT